MNMKKMTALALVGVMTLSLAACSQSAPQAENTQIPNPVVEYDTLADAAGAAGFDMEVPDTVKGYDRPAVQVVNGELLQVTYRNGEDKVTIRKAAGDGDISGDYNQYGEESTVNADGAEVCLKGNDGTVSLATWQRDGYTYSIFVDSGISTDTMTALAESVR